MPVHLIQPSEGIIAPADKHADTDFRGKLRIRRKKGDPAAPGTLGTAPKKNHGMGGCGKATGHHGVDIRFCGFGSISPNDILPLDGRSRRRIGNNHHPRLLNRFLGLIQVTNSPDSLADIRTKETFRTDAALKAAFRLKLHLGFT